MSEKFNSPLTILQLTARNVTNLKAVRITPDKNVIVLTGANEAGKSNVLDVIQSMLEGLKLKMPIREGEERADAELDLGEIKIRKRWTEKGDSLEVYRVMEDGKKQTFSSPQTFLNELTGRMVDPMKLFVLHRDDQKKFRDVLANLVGLNLQDLKDEEAKIREDRKEVNNRVKAAIAQIQVMPEPDPSTPDEEITFRDKLNDLNRLREKRDFFERFERDIATMKAGLKEKADRIAQIDQQIERLKEEKAQVEKMIDSISHQIGEKESNVPERISQEQIMAAESEIEKIEETNKLIRQAARYRREVKNAEKAKAESEDLTIKLERIEQDKQTRIGACQFPVQGLSLTEDQVIYEGKPLDVASSGRQIRIFVEMAMAMSPMIKVLLVRDGSLLDRNGFKEVCEIAQEKGYQVWLEKTDESGQEGFFIVDGEVEAIDGKAVEHGEHEGEPQTEKDEAQPSMENNDANGVVAGSVIG